ncbi:MAG TPA: hypothetical protein VI215_04870 [Bacteroidota bacterium]|jgi:hypothetical protein
MGSNITLAVGALIIFSTFLSSSNKLMIMNTQLAEQNEYYLTALSLGESLISEAKAKAFDQMTVTNPVTLTDSLSSVLGTEGVSETIPSPDTLITSTPYTAATPGFRSGVKFNDVDDYNGYKRKVNTQRAEGYTLSAKVAYASPTYPDSIKSGVKTFCKTMTVVVKSPFIPDSVSLSYTFLY